MKKNTIHKLIATVLGAGYSPLAPGTVGALFGIVFLYGYHYFFQTVNFYSWQLLILTIAITILGTWSTDNLEKEWGKDPSKVVIDELVGVWITLLWIPFELEWVILGFILFRFFDITKPLFIRNLEKMKGGLGVMLDDVLAGIYSNVVLQLIIYFWNG